MRAACGNSRLAGQVVKCASLRMKNRSRPRESLHQFAIAAFAGVLALFHCQPLAAQTYEFAVAKTKVYLQTNSSPPVLDHDLPFMFQAQACADDPLFFLSSVTLQPPGRPSQPMSLTSSLVCFAADAAFDTKQELDAAYPPGTYTCVIEGFWGDSVTLQIPLIGDDYPAPERGAVLGLADRSTRATAHGPRRGGTRFITRAVKPRRWCASTRGTAKAARGEKSW